MPVARLYDLLNAVLFAPSGGSGRLRQQLVDALAPAAGDRVLELGCGTGQVTERLLAAGARVVAVDALPEMLEGARRRAPEAEYVVGERVGIGRGALHVQPDGVVGFRLYVIAPAPVRSLPGIAPVAA